MRLKYRMKRQLLAAVNIQRVFRGHLGRQKRRFLRKQIESAIKIQGCYRKSKAVCHKLLKILQHRERIFSAVQIQSFYRGCLGRVKSQMQRLDVKRRTVECTLASRYKPHSAISPFFYSKTQSNTYPNFLSTVSQLIIYYVNAAVLIKKISSLILPHLHQSFKGSTSSS
jgi:hypothetical protein